MNDTAQSLLLLAAFAGSIGYVGGIVREAAHRQHEWFRPAPTPPDPADVTPHLLACFLDDVHQHLDPTGRFVVTTSIREKVE